MDKLNKELISIKNQLNILSLKKETTSDKYNKLQNKLHLYLDSSKYKTIDTEKYIISDFWSNAYKNYSDGGYITNDMYLAETRFTYETLKLEKILKKNCKNSIRALDIGCGNGRYSKHFSKLFDEVIGIDLSKQRIEKNTKKNTKKNISYLNENFITMKKDTLGKFDFVFVGDIFMYTCDKNIKDVYSYLLKLLNKDGVLIVRESTLKYGKQDWKSKNYVAYYRNQKFYKTGIFKDNFQKMYKNYGYSLYYLDKYFTTYKDKKNDIRMNPVLLENVVENYVDKYQRSSFFYIYKLNS